MRNSITGGGGRLFMVAFTLSGLSRIRVLGARVLEEEARAAAARLQQEGLSVSQTEQIVAIHKVRRLLNERGLSWDTIMGGRWHAEPTDPERLIEVQERLRTFPLSHDGRWLVDLLVSR